MSLCYIEVCYIREFKEIINWCIFLIGYCENIFVLMKEKVFYFLNIKIYFRNKLKLVIK